MFRSLVHTTSCARHVPLSSARTSLQSQVRQLFRRAPRYPHDPGIYYTSDLHFSQGPRLRTRILRSLLWASLFGGAGIYGAMSYRDWMYQKLGSVVPDSELDAAMVMEVMQQIDDSPMVQALKNDPTFKEVWPLATNQDLYGGTSGAIFEGAKEHLIFTALRGTRGVFPRVFWCSDRAVLCMIVGFGFGLEGGTSRVHGGVVTTMVTEAMRLLASVWMRGNNYKLVDVNVSFSVPLPVQSVCCITVIPASTVVDLQDITSNPKVYGHWPSWVNDPAWEAKVSTFIAYVGQTDGHPLRDTKQNCAYAAARFEVEGDSWPPDPPSPSDESEEDSGIT